MGFFSASLNKMIYHRQKTMLENQKHRIANAVFRAHENIGKAERNLTQQETAEKQRINIKYNSVFSSIQQQAALEIQKLDKTDSAYAQNYQLAMTTAQQMQAEWTQAKDAELNYNTTVFEDYKANQLEYLTAIETDLKSRETQIDGQIKLIDSYLATLDSEIDGGAKSLVGGSKG